MTTKRQIRCAIYTRKSTEEGLEQDFNSLDAQRDACAAYILSQKVEGWVAIGDHYDDGGYSGGTLERPALTKLLADVERGGVDVVVVYKIDRLSRSLMDFAKLVEVFDRRSVTFVSVTQSFNTTTSMGRLTLNVLLSFAQFEREVIGERIRDKFAASKRRGIWMGGNPPLGYDVRDRKLVVNPSEAEVIRGLFGRYLELGCVRLLCNDCGQRGIVSKLRKSAGGEARGGKPIGRSALYQILNNRTYLGELPHKGSWHRGEHDAVVPRELFNAVQNKLAEQRPLVSDRARVRNEAPYASMLFDETGASMLPTYTVKRRGLRYCYYASRPVLKGETSAATITRVPAPALEALLEAVWKRFGIGDGKENAAPSPVTRIQIQPQSIVAVLRKQEAFECWQGAAASPNEGSLREFMKDFRSRLLPAEALDDRADELVLTLPVRAKFRGGRASVQYTPGRDAGPIPDMALIKAIARAYRYRQMLTTGEASSIEALASHFGQDRGYVGQVLKLAFLSPDLTHMIMRGEQPAGLRLAHLLRADMPLDWAQQRDAIARLACAS